MYRKLIDTITQVSNFEISSDRKEILEPLINFIQRKKNENQPIVLHFICTHNSRRSHLAQLWCYAMAEYFGVQEVHSFSGGTETTAIFHKIIETVKKQGFSIDQLTTTDNPIFSIKTADYQTPLIGFSKIYNHPINPQSSFAAIMTCSSADQGCPFIEGAEIRIPITYEDPKISDDTSEMDKTYFNRSLEIASEMYYVMNAIQ